MYICCRAALTSHVKISHLQKTEPWLSQATTQWLRFLACVHSENVSTNFVFKKNSCTSKNAPAWILVLTTWPHAMQPYVPMNINYIRRMIKNVLH